MRLGISSALTHSTPEEWAEKQVKLGCSSVVFPVNCDAGEAVIDAYAKAAKENDLMIAEVGIWRNAIAADPAERQKNMDYSIRQLQMADRLGACCCVNVAGSMGPVWDGGYRENYSVKAFDQTVRMIQEVIDEAKPVNTYFTIEPMPWMVPHSAEMYLQLIDAVKRDRFAVHMDMINLTNSPKMYFFAEENIEHTFKLLGAFIKSCHIKDVHLRPEYTFQLQECMIGKGEFPARFYLDKIEELNPEMPVILEHLNTDEEYYEGFRYLQKLYNREGQE